VGGCDVPSREPIDPTGLTGRVTTAITATDPGEVEIELGGGSQTFTATSADGSPIARHTPVVVEWHQPPDHVVVMSYSA
jgi:hypothetical protein